MEQILLLIKANIYLAAMCAAHTTTTDTLLYRLI